MPSCAHVFVIFAITLVELIHNTRAVTIGSDSGSASTWDCDHLVLIPSDTLCSFVRQNCSSHVPAALFNYLVFYYCDMSSSIYQLVTVWVCFFLWSCALFYLLGALSKEHFCPILDTVSSGLRMSPELAGITFLALGNGATDVFSIFAGIINHSYALSIGELTGSAIYLTSFLFGLVATISPVYLKPFYFYRDLV